MYLAAKQENIELLVERRGALVMRIERNKFDARTLVACDDNAQEYGLYVPKWFCGARILTACTMHDLVDRSEK
jgi:hypothetical protein